MLLTVEEQRRQKKIAQKLEYNRTHKEERKLSARARSKAHTLETTARRIKGHTIDDLIKIAQLCCSDRYDDYLAKQDSIVGVLQFLLGPTNVLSRVSSDDIFNQELSQILSSDQENSKSHESKSTTGI